MIEEDGWRSQQRHGADNDGSVDRLQGPLTSWTKSFAQQRLCDESMDLRLGRRGLHAEEARTFLAALDGGHVEVDAAYMKPTFCRPKPGGGRYCLSSANTYTGDPYVTLNTEYLTHVGAGAELVIKWAWWERTAAAHGTHTGLPGNARADTKELAHTQQRGQRGSHHA